MAKEAFENGLLTKKEHEVVTSQQELHTLLRAAYCLATTNKWMLGSGEQVKAAIGACQEAVVLFYSYCFKDGCDKNTLSSEVMAKIQHVKALFEIKPFTNSDPLSFIPDSYRAVENGPVPFTIDDFAKVMGCFQKHHESVCQTFSVQTCDGNHHASHANCITAVQTQTESLATECHKTSHKSSEQQIRNRNILVKPEISNQLAETIYESEDIKPGEKDQNAKTPEISGRSSSLGSSWTSLSEHYGTSPVLVDPFCCTEVDDDDDDSVDSKQNRQSEGAETANANTHTRKTLSFQAEAKHPKRSMQKLCTTLESEDVSDGATGASMTNDRHQDCTDFSFLSLASQQQSNQELCITLGSEESYQISNYFDGKDKNTGKSSGSISSLGSSWQSVSFSRSLPTADFTDILENKAAVDQSCETLPSEDGSGSSFEYLNLNSSASSIQKEHFSPPYQTGSDASKAQIGSLDPKQSLPSTELDSFEFLQVDPSKSKQGNTTAANVKVSETEDDAYEGSQTSQKKMMENTHSGQCPSNYKNSPLFNQNCRNGCFQDCEMGSVVLTELDYRFLLSGVCQGCLLRRLPDKPFKLSHYNRAYSTFLPIVLYLYLYIPIPIPYSKDVRFLCTFGQNKIYLFIYFQTVDVAAGFHHTLVGMASIGRHICFSVFLLYALF